MTSPSTFISRLPPRSLSHSLMLAGHWCHQTDGLVSDISVRFLPLRPSQLSPPGAEGPISRMRGWTLRAFPLRSDVQPAEKNLSPKQPVLFRPWFPGKPPCPGIGCETTHSALSGHSAQQRPLQSKDSVSTLGGPRPSPAASSAAYTGH